MNPLLKGELKKGLLDGNRWEDRFEGIWVWGFLWKEEMKCKQIGKWKVKLRKCLDKWLAGPGLLVSGGT